jgi:uncharacterized protein YndB with AHSA1/START domain
MAQAIHEEIRFDASPARVYSALTDAREFAAFSGFGGHVVGRNVELDPGRRVVQAWRAASWTPGVYSIVRFELTGQSGSTALVFDQAGFPDNEAAHLAQGWHRMYWEPLRRYLGASP